MNKAQIKKDLKKVKQILLKYKWTKGAYARKANGRTLCSTLDKDAKCFCLRGAILKADVSRDVTWFLHDNAPAHYWGLISFNDAPETKKKDVLRLIDTCIALLK